MLTGFNTDVEFGGKTYHVQTEDRDEGDEPIFESLVYVQGQILDAYRTQYANLIAKGYDQAALASVLESQHKRVMRWIKNGRYDPDAVRPFGEGIITDRSFDHVVLEFLREQAAQEKPELELELLGELAPGWTSAVRIHLRSERLKRPIPEALVVVQLVPSGEGGEVRLFQGTSDAKGTVMAEVTVPDAAPGTSVVVRAETPMGVVEATARVL